MISYNRLLGVGVSTHIGGCKFVNIRTRGWFGARYTTIFEAYIYMYMYVYLNGFGTREYANGIQHLSKRCPKGIQSISNGYPKAVQKL